MTSEEKEETTEVHGQSISLQLGDVVRITSPTNEILDNHVFYIDYIDSSKIVIINKNTLRTSQLRINEDGTLGDNSITSIAILFRNEQRGYARQNGLLPSVWVNVYFGGDMPIVVSGEITNLEEDMIEIKTYPDNDILYINFAYKGIPEDIPIETIEIRGPPEDKINTPSVAAASVPGVSEEKEEKEQEPEEKREPDEKEEEKRERELEEGEIEEAEEDEDDEEQVQIPVARVKETIREFIIRADELQFGEEFEAVSQLITVEESKRRFNIDVQSNDLLEEMLSSVPNAQRTSSVLNSIHTMIERFKQLRMQFSEFNEHDNITGFKKISALWKPLAENLATFKTVLYWILPVAKNVKKIYNINSAEEEDNPDIITLNITEDVDNMRQIIQSYRSNEVPEEQNKYVTMMNELNSHFTPFEDINPETTNTAITSFDVISNLHAIMDNLDNLYSTVVDRDIVKTRRFVVQKYNTGLQRLDVAKMDGSMQRIRLTNSDTLTVKSILTLPEAAISFSHINLPGTSIMSKANLNMTFVDYWQLLKKSTNVDTLIVDNLEKEFEFSETNYVNNIKNYVLSKTDEMSELDSMQLYNRFLKVIVPKTKILFQLMKKYIQGKLSLVNIIEYLEPFLIYTKDLTFTQYKEINQFIQEKISEYNRNFVERGRIFAQLLGSKVDNSQNAMSITRLIPASTVNSQNKDVFEAVYKYDPSITPMTTSELLRKITLTDYGNLFNASISLENMVLMLPEDVSDILEEESTIDKKTNTGEKPQSKCINYIIAKQYNSSPELMADNGKTIYFDKQFDKTDYSVIDSYGKQLLDMSSDKFFEYLSKEMMKRFKYSLEKDAVYMAETLIQGMKKVVDGDYAIIYELSTGNDKIKYYKRESNTWVLDTNINEEAMATDANLLCNFQKDCIEVSKKYNDICESYDTNKSDLTQKAMHEMVHAFDANYETSKIKLDAQLKSNVEYYSSISEKLADIAKYRVYKYNNQQQKLGVEGTDEDTVGYATPSPYMKLLNLIMGQSDFVKKQTDLVQFAIRFTRDANDAPPSNSGEDSHWRYCIETNVKLLPAFLYTLASCFVNNPTDYQQKVSYIIKENGALSDDGDAWVDKYSGYVIRQIDLDVDEGYDEGYKVVSRSVMEQDASEVLLKQKTPTIKYTTPETRMMSNVISAMAGYMGINVEDQRDFIIKVASASLPRALPSEADYKVRIMDMSKRGKDIPSYKTIYNGSILYLALGAFLIGVQTSIPSVRTRKTFPGCVKSFDGFPFEGVGDMSALTYVACVAHKIRSETDPWSALERQKVTTVIERLKTYITTYLLNDQDVIRKTEEKNEYLLIHPIETIPIEHDLSRWTNFLPPLKPIHLEKLSNITPDFERAMLQELKSGSGKQQEKILIVKSKIIVFSLGIQEKIQKILDKKKALLTNGANEPFIENACCNENDSISSGSNKNNSALKYFEKDDSDISLYNDIVDRLSNILADIDAITKSPYLFCRENSKNQYPPLSDNFNESTIYQAYIVLCRFHALAPLSGSLLAICSEKPENLNKTDSLIEQIRKLKQDGRNYTNESLLRLLQVVNRANIVDIIGLDKPIIGPIQGMQNVLELLNRDDDKRVPSTLRERLELVLDPNGLAVKEDTPEMRALKNYLITSNTKMKQECYNFIKTNSNSSKKVLKTIEYTIQHIMDWGSDKKTTAKEQKDDTTIPITTAITYGSIQFVKEYIQNMLKTFPSIIANKVDYKSIHIPRYWKLSGVHENDIRKIVAGYYANLRGFYGDTTISKILTRVQSDNDGLIDLVEKTPVFTQINYRGETIYSTFDKKTSLLLFENYFMQALMEYVTLTDDDEMIVREPTIENEEEDIGTYTVEDNEEEETREYPVSSSPGERMGQRMGQRMGESAIYLGNRKELKTQISKLLIVFLNTLMEHKDIVDISHEKVMDMVFKSKEKEKETFTDRLEALTTEERNIDTMLKINKLGAWSKGLQKGLTSYVKNTYDEERDAMEKLVEVERNLRKNGNVTDTNLEQFTDDFLEEERMGEEIEREEYNMGRMTEDYMDGNYDGDEAEDYDEYN